MLIKVEGQRATFTGPFTPSAMWTINLLEGRRHWAKDGKSLTFEGSFHNIQMLSRIPGVRLVKDAPPADVRPQPKATSYVTKEPSFDHQLRALGKMRGKNFFGLFMEQGTGKTKTLIDWAGELYSSGKITGVLVVSKKGVHRQWVESEVPRHLGVPSEVAFWPVTKKLPDRLAPSRNHLAWLAFNYDGLKTQAGMRIAKEFCKLHHGSLLIVADESQEIKNYRSARFKAMCEIAPAASHRALSTGTPIAKDLCDEWAQLKWMDERIVGIRYITTFKSRFCIMGGFENRAAVGHKNVEEFKVMTAPYIFRATKEEIGILPKLYATWNYDLNGEQIKAIRDLKKELATELGGNKFTIKSAVEALIKVQQISSGFIVNEGQTTLLMPIKDNPKVNAALDWVRSNDGKFIIWSRFRAEMEMLASAFKAEGVEFVEYHGGVSDKDRASAVKSFLQKDGGAQGLSANAQTAGTGLNLQGGCQRALYYSNSFAAIDRWQSEDRIHRIGTAGSVVYTDLVAKGSLDNHIIKNLRKKKGLSDLVLDDFKQLIGDLG